MTRSWDRKGIEILDSGHCHVYQIQVKQHCFNAYHMIIVTTLASWQVANLKKSISQAHHGLGLGLLLYLMYLGRGAWEGASVVAMLASYISTSQSAYSTPQSCRSRLGQSRNLFHALYYGQIPMPLPKDHGFFDIRLKSLKKSMISWSKFFITKAFLAVIRSEMVKYPPLIVAKLGEGFPKK